MILSEEILDILDGGVQDGGETDVSEALRKV